MLESDLPEDLFGFVRVFSWSVCFPGLFFGVGVEGFFDGGFDGWSAEVLGEDLAVRPDQEIGRYALAAIIRGGPGRAVTLDQRLWPRQLLICDEFLHGPEFPVQAQTDEGKAVVFAIGIVDRFPGR